jgi:hypothetical protein
MGLLMRRGIERPFVIQLASWRFLKYRLMFSMSYYGDIPQMTAQPECEIRRSIVIPGIAWNLSFEVSCPFRFASNPLQSVLLFPSALAICKGQVGLAINPESMPPLDIIDMTPELWNLYL